MTRIDKSNMRFTNCIDPEKKENKKLETDRSHPETGNEGPKFPGLRSPEVMSFFFLFSKGS